MAATVKFKVLGKSKYVHVVRSKAQDLKATSKGGSGCQQVRKYTVAGKIDYKQSMSPSAAKDLDPCPQCHTDEVLKPMLKPTAEERKAKRDETMDKFREEQKTSGQRKKDKAKGSKPKKVKATKSGPRSVGGDSQSKADALAAFAKEHGWASGTKDADPGVMVVARRGEETIRCFFVDGKYDTTRHAYVEVGDWRGKLRGVHGCRNQMAGEGRDRPHPNPGVGRSAPRSKKKEEAVPEDESPEDAKRRVPFSVDDDSVVIIDILKGKTIRWRNGTSGAIEEAWLPADPKGKKCPKIKIVDHPKSGKRFISFFTVTSVNEHGEQYGPERSVFLDKIIRVI